MTPKNDQPRTYILIRWSYYFQRLFPLEEGLDFLRSIGNSYQVDDGKIKQDSLREGPEITVKIIDQESFEEALQFQALEQS